MYIDPQIYLDALEFLCSDDNDCPAFLASFSCNAIRKAIRETTDRLVTKITEEERYYQIVFDIEGLFPEKTTQLERAMCLMFMHEFASTEQDLPESTGMENVETPQRIVIKMSGNMRVIQSDPEMFC